MSDLAAMSDLDATYGALFVGVLVSAVFFGVTMLQAFVYFQQYPSDRVWGKLAVCWLWFLDAFHLAFSGHFVYYYLIVNFNNPSALSPVIWSFKLRTVIDGLVVVSVHSLYTFRLWTLLAIDDHVAPFGEQARRWSSQKSTLPACASRWMMRRIVPWFVSVLVLAGYAIAIVMCYETFKVKTFERLSHTPFATYVPLVCSAVIDAVIAGSLCYFLARCRTEFGAMNGPLRTLMVYTLNTGIISSVCSLIAISMMVAFPNTFITIAIEFLVIKLYINSYLAMLNARGGLSNHPNGRAHPGYTPNTSIHLREVVEVEHKHVPFSPFGPFPHSYSSVHLPDQRQVCPLTPGRTSGDGRQCHGLPHDFVVDLLHASSPDIPALRAPRLSHPDVCLQHGVVEAAPPVTVAPNATQSPTRTTARRLRSPSEAHSEAGSVPASPSVDHPPPTVVHRASSSPPTPPPLPSASSWPSSLGPPPPQDYPSPPERALSPLRFASPPSSLSFPSPISTVSGAEGSSDASPSPTTSLPMVSRCAPREGRDRYTRMVRSARSERKVRRQLFDENGVALMWGLHEERLAAASEA